MSYPTFSLTQRLTFLQKPVRRTLLIFESSSQRSLGPSCLYEYYPIVATLAQKLWVLSLSGREHRYLYAAAALHPTLNRPQQALLKLDTHTMQSTMWHRGVHHYVGEPIFVPLANRSAFRHKYCSDSKERCWSPIYFVHNEQKTSGPKINSTDQNPNPSTILLAASQFNNNWEYNINPPWCNRAENAGHPSTLTIMTRD